MVRSILVVLVLTSSLSAQTPAPSPNPSAVPPGNAEKGKKIFVAYGCYQCHGYAAHGGPGGRLAPRPLAFTAFSRYVRRPAGSMPLYTSKVVSDQELADIYAFLLSVPASPPVESIPLLSAP